jgi:hypothetical protein
VSEHLEEKIVYFTEPGINNTAETLRLAGERARARGITKIVLASTRGETAVMAADKWSGAGLKIIVIPHQYGFAHDGRQRFSSELVQQLEKQGHSVHFGTMLFHTEKLYRNNSGEALANLLRTFCEGMKVCLEIIMMAADGGQIAVGEKVIAVAGSREGADTAVVATASTSNRIADLHIDRKSVV